VRLALQPVDGPSEPAALLHLIDQLQSDELLMFSTDYPHMHTDDGLDAVPAGLPDAVAEKLMDGNARAHYRL
jgi:predicted TIM-barrel fold metal-dependent hydrolase